MRLMRLRWLRLSLLLLLLLLLREKVAVVRHGEAGGGSGMRGQEVSSGEGGGERAVERPRPGHHCWNSVTELGAG